MLVNLLFIRENYRASTKLRVVDNSKITNYNGFFAAVAQKIGDVCENHDVTAKNNHSE